MDKISSIKDGIIDFELKPNQKKLLKKIHSSKRLLIQATRQQGLTTCLVKYVSDWCTFNESSKIAIISNTNLNSRELLQKISIMNELKSSQFSKNSMDLNSNFIQIYTSARIKEAYEKCDLIIVDCPLFIPNAKTFFESINDILIHSMRNEEEHNSKIILANSGLTNESFNPWLSLWFSDDYDGKLFKRFVLESDKTEKEIIEKNKAYYDQHYFDAEFLNKIKITE